MAEQQAKQAEGFYMRVVLTAKKLHSDFVKKVEEISGQDLTEFFDSWLYADTIPAIPELDLSSD
ncbi:MAG TPA: hypothetical protein PLA25_08845 [Anaerolineaceae bacterium]|nr:hypothetical protein [Anaerolineaceae bacterium]